MSWSIRCICVITRWQGRVGKDIRMDAENRVIEGRRKDLLAQACRIRSEGSELSGVLRNAVENTLIFRTSNLLYCKTVDLCCFIPKLMVIHNNRH